jgi:putative ABC transport system permease protein
MRLLWANLWRKKTRAIVTFASVFVAFLLFAVLAATRQAFVGGLDLIGNERLLTIHRSGLIFSLPIAYRNRIASLEGVHSVSIGIWMQGYFQEQRNFVPLIAIDDDAYFPMYREIVVPPEQLEAWKRDRQGAIIGKGIAARRDWKIGDTVPIRSGIYRNNDGTNTWETRISGIYDTTNKAFDTESMLIHYEYLNESRTFDRDQVGWFIVKLDDPNQAPQVAKAVDALFANSPRETKTSSEKAFAESFTGQLGNIGLIIQYVVSAVLFSLLLVTATTMAQAVRERTAELAVLKAIGFAEGRIVRMVIGESVLMVMFGALIGLGFGWLVCGAMAPALGQFMPAFQLLPRDVAFGATLALAMGVLSGVWPAWQAMRMRVVDALRGV